MTITLMHLEMSWARVRRAKKEKKPSVALQAGQVVQEQTGGGKEDANLSGSFSQVTTSTRFA